MASSEPTASPKEMLLPVSVEQFFRWDDFEEIHLSDLEDSSSDEDTTGRETSHLRDFQQDSPGLFLKLSSLERSRHSNSSSSIEEPQEEPALMQQKGQKWLNRLTGSRREQYQVVSKSPTGKSKSPSSSQQSHKSQPSPQSLGQKIASKFSTMFGTARPSIINLATITNQTDVPQKVRTCKV